jgi:hypothetical protein
MMHEDFLFPYLARFFAFYLGELNITSADAYERGPNTFADWLRKHIPSDEAPPSSEEILDEADVVWEEEEEDTHTEDDMEPLHIIRHLLSDQTSEWLSPYWGRLITSFREVPTHPIVEIYAAFVVRWDDGHVLPFVSVVPENLVRPQGTINDQLLVHLVDVFSSQFVELLTSHSADDLYELQSGLIHRDVIKKVLRLAKEAILNMPEEERVPLHHALRFLRAVSLPLLPPEALRKAAENLLPDLKSKPDWRIFPIGGEDEEK